MSEFMGDNDRLRLEEPTPDVRAVITDIEGTTSDIAFVHEVLFPYARDYLPPFVRAHAQEPTVAALIEDVRTEADEPDADLDRVITILEKWMDEDRKATPLKTLQGLVWEKGYIDGDFTGHVYDDAVATLQAWADDRRALYVYSSGSVAAQKLLFTYSDHGDLSDLFSGYFDTRIGGKKKMRSYKAIAAELGELPASLLFLSDVGEELDAAANAGLQTCWVARDENTQEKARMSERHPVVASFEDIELI
ncbi:enolase-phosphatase [Salinisphaera shabanensis T35B1]|jgi:enolase-phosphatase E1|uniref:Enolase-phosphatase E1 n=1 Tax=Salinisphaera shabanensis E1L3A TaxID=1033802 RepID=U2E9G0_9GAMM|nr:acireductone synthase [Salinisphaera shabanensis]ERJ20336.1 Enolase-phosphatase E1 protein [Salinisphaera shabanensis E1L3A]